ncbi:MAG: insulinase family protein [Betaproteobacteria bacterium]|nr:MAG: insulinase family protein [Betaproteobacteria bacterium]
MTLLPRLLAGAIGAALAMAALAAPPLKLNAVPFSERTLPNGLQVVAVENHASPTVSVQVWYHVGSKDDPQGRSGFAHLFEHLMFKSTRYMKAETIERLTEDVGGASNAFTADDMTAYHEVVPSNHLERLLWAEAERMSNLNVDEGNFKSERAVVEEEYRQRVLASPYGRFYNAIAPSSYLVHPYKRPGIGSIEDLEASTLSDVVSFHSTYSKQLQGWVDKYFAPVPRPSSSIPRVTAQEPTWSTDREAAVSGPQVPLPAVALVWQAPPVTSADAPALLVAAALLAQGESSRLNQSLVYRQQIAAEAGFEADLRAGPGLLTAYAIAAGGKPLAQVRAALLAEVLRMADKPVSPAELEKVKTQLVTHALGERQTPMGLASAFAEAAVLHGQTAKANTLLDELQQVSAADVQRVMKHYIAGTHKVSISYAQDKPQGGTK